MARDGVRGFEVGIVCAGAVVLTLACGRGEPPPTRAPPATSAVNLPALTTGRLLAQELPDDATHAYLLSLAAGEYLHLRIDQRGVDVVVTLSDPAARPLLRIDSPTGTRGAEHLFVVAESSGPHRLEIRAWEGAEADGRYEMTIEALRPATEEDRRRAAAAMAYSQARILEGEGQPDVEGAARAYREAARLWGELNDSARQAQALYRLGKLYAASDAHRRQGIEPLSHSLDLLRRLGDERQEAIVLYHLGALWGRLGEVARTDDCYQRALALWQKLGNRTEQAARLNDLALLRVHQGRVHDAIDLYGRALELWQSVGDRRRQATTRTNLGILYATLGDAPAALGQYRRALALLDDQPGADQRAVTLNKLGDVLLWLEGPQAALEPYRQALELRRRQHDKRGEAVTLNSIGLAQVQADRPRQALAAFQESVEIFRRSGAAADQAVALNNLALAYEGLDELPRAQEYYQSALELAREDSHRQAEANALYGLARVARAEGRLADAESLMEQTLEILETLRSRARRLDLRSSYLAIQQDHYGFLIELLAERHRREPAAGHGARAFAVSERMRARSLLDALSALPAGTEAGPATRLEALGQAINRRHLDLLRFSPLEAASGEVAELQDELTALLESFWQADAGRQIPPAARAEPPTLTLAEVQSQLLDDETLLLEYYLGESRSLLWAVTSSDMRFVTGLPGREELEKLAQRTYSQMLESHRQTGEMAARQSAAKLSRLILGPVADLLQRRRLVVVAPGALQYVPFAALPDPEAAQQGPRGALPPLIVDHEIVSLPSASVLAALRHKIAGRRPPAGLLALVADPVFGPQDARLGNGRPGPEGQAAPARASRREPEPPLERLDHARREGEAILSLATTGPVLAAFGLEARRELVASGRLAGYRIVHFATHGLFDTEHPELSAIVLSRLDAAGDPVDGYLRAYEIFRLDLPVDLVVLSACRTALGEEIRGEGLVGLTHGFMHAGAARVLVSLWNVNDHATRELMERFYRSLLRQQLPPAQALRQAQIALWREGRWRAPYYWAGFVLQGEWE